MNVIGIQPSKKAYPALELKPPGFIKAPSWGKKAPVVVHFEASSTACDRGVAVEIQDDGP